MSHRRQIRTSSEESFDRDDATARRSRTERRLLSLSAAAGIVLGVVAAGASVAGASWQEAPERREAAVRSSEIESGGRLFSWSGDAQPVQAGDELMDLEAGLPVAASASVNGLLERHRSTMGASVGEAR